MSWGHVRKVVGLLWLYIWRRVLGRGILRAPIIKWAALIAVLVAFAAYCLLSVAVLRGLLSDADMATFLIKVAGVSSFFWVLVIYVVVRVLFLKADALLEHTYSLPVTNKERALALTVFELSVLVVASSFSFGAFVVAALVTVGPSIASTLVFTIVAPLVVGYLMVHLAYLLCESLLSRIGLSRFRGLLIPILLSIMLLFIFQHVNAQSQALIQAYPGRGEGFIPQLLFVDVLAANGPVVATLLLLAISGGLLVMNLVASPRRYTPLKRYVKLLPGILTSHPLGAHVLVVARSFDSLIVALFVIAITGLLILNRVVMPPYVLVLLTFQGVYALAGSQPLRHLCGFRRSAMREYLYILAAQLGWFIAVALPVTLSLMSTGVTIEACLLVWGICVANIVLCTMVGIVFPAERGNPFSVIIGMVLMVVVAATVGLGLNLFSLPIAVNAGLVAALGGVAMFYSVLGIRTIESRNRNEVAY